MKNKLKNFFNYSSSERKGSIALVVILLIALSGYWIINLIKESSDEKFDSLSNEIESLTKLDVSQSQNSKEVVYFEFNPNEINKQSWMKLGFSEKQAQSIIKYREKGGYFYKKEDLKRLYVVSDSLYNLLEPFIIIQSLSKASSSNSLDKCYFVKLIEDTIPVYDSFTGIEKVICDKKEGKYFYYIGGFSNAEIAKREQVKVSADGFEKTEVVHLNCNFGFVINKEKSSNNYKKKQLGDGVNSLKSEIKNFKVEVNSADTTMFKSLKGIGSYYSNRIVKYRNALGGYYNIEQIKEVYGIPQEVVDQNINRLIIDTLNIVKININECETGDLKKHPYISWNIANSIVQIRKSQKPYNSIEEIKKSDLVNEEIYRKIAPYLKTE